MNNYATTIHSFTKRYLQLCKKYNIDRERLADEIVAFKRNGKTLSEIKGQSSVCTIFEIDSPSFLAPQKTPYEILVLEGELSGKVVEKKQGEWKKQLQAYIKNDGVIVPPKEHGLLLDNRLKTAKTIAIYFGSEALNFSKEVNQLFFGHPDIPSQLGFSTHETVLFLPRPADDEASQMICEYYDEQADVYYENDQQIEHRLNYKKAINQIIADDIRSELPEIKQMLAVACGSGDRAKCIREYTNLEYHITGVDTSPAMCQQAQKSDFKIFQADLSKTKVPTQHRYNAATFLYAFGHIPSHKRRLQVLRNIHAALETGAHFYMDVFNLEDTDEWRPHIQDLHQQWKLEEQDYELGNVFYQRVGGTAAAFLHYFKKEEIVDLLKTSGFMVGNIWRIDYCQTPGVILNDSENRGNWLVKAVKK